MFKASVLYLVIFILFSYLLWQGKDLSYAQAIALIPLSAIIFFLLMPQLVPNLVLKITFGLLIIFASFIAIIINQNLPAEAKDFDLVLAKFSSDPLSTGQIGLLKGIEQNFSKLNFSLALAKISKNVETPNAARQHLAQDRNSALLWGDRSALHLSLNSSLLNSTEFSTISQYFVNDLRSIKLSNSLDHIVLPYSPIRDSAAFVAIILKAVSKKDKQSEILKLDLIEALNYHANWTDVSHRSAAGLILANIYLEELLSTEPIQSALIRCVMRVFKQAEKNLQTKNNPELKAAIYNNMGVTKYLSFLISKNPLMLGQARYYWKKSSKISTKYTNLNHQSINLAQHNLVYIESTYGNWLAFKKNKKKGKKLKFNKIAMSKSYQEARNLL